ncbi:MAG: hypothetical protein LBK99_27685 [Opitutaceae bacterium]|jgi:hypothetical protein|nr:hypothetical protein [Opitutaceae bacterium]
MRKPKHLIHLATLASLLTITTHAGPITDWTLSTSPGATAARNAAGVITLADNSPADTPRATHQFPEPVTHGQLHWRARHMQGRGTLVHTLRLHTTDRQTREIAVYNGALYLKKTGERGHPAYVPAGQDWFAIGTWADFRLAFDTRKNIAQLYLNNAPVPLAELKQIDAPVTRITLTAGHDIAIGNAAEFADISLDTAPIDIKQVKRHPQPRPARAQRSDAWPEPNPNPAPADWTVRDKFQQFADWWPANLANPAAANARDALKNSIRREALGIGNEFTSAMRLLPGIANSIRTEPPFAGAQQSHLYRSSPGKWTDWDRPSNTRIMECVTQLARFYALGQPWNPYHRDPALGKRLTEALHYWLALQTPEGGFPEYAGFGSGELPSTSFGLMCMVEIYDALKDEPLFAGLSPRWVESMKHAVRWNSIPGSPQRNQGISHANQILGVISGAWHLHRITGEPGWKTLYDELTDWWTSTAQSKEGWYREGGGREDFSYSQVSDLYGDRLAIETGDPRWIKSLRRAYLASQYIVVYEMDKKTALLDVTGHARTQPAPALNFPRMPSGAVTNPRQIDQPRQRYMGWFNHIATLVPEARAFAINAITPEKAADREDAFFRNWPASLAWLAQPSHVRGAQRGAYAWDDAANGTFWTLPADAMQQAVTQTRPWKETRFTESFRDDMNEQELSCVRRPGYYATIRSGRANGKQVPGLGLVWVPGFGSVFVSSNDSPRPAFGWRRTGAETKREIRRMTRIWSGPSPEKSGSLTLSCENFPSFRFDFADETLGIRTEGAPLHLPLLNRSGEEWTLADGSAWNGKQVVTTFSLRLHRVDQNVTHDVVLAFARPVVLEMAAPHAVAEDIIIRSLSVTPVTSGPLEITMSRAGK